MPWPGARHLEQTEHDPLIETQCFVVVEGEPRAGSGEDELDAAKRHLRVVPPRLRIACEECPYRGCMCFGCELREEAVLARRVDLPLIVRANLGKLEVVQA